MEKLLGDMAEDALKTFGADKLVQFYERKTGRSCNCAGRRQMLNNIHRAAQRAFERSQQPTKQRQAVRPPMKIEQPVHSPPTKPVDE